MLNWAPGSVVGEITGKRGSLFNLYGGMFLGFRHYARGIGDRIMERFGERRYTKADDPAAWLAPIPTAEPLAEAGNFQSDHVHRQVIQDLEAFTQL